MHARIIENNKSKKNVAYASKNKFTFWTQKINKETRQNIKLRKILAENRPSLIYVI